MRERDRRPGRECSASGEAAAAAEVKRLGVEAGFDLIGVAAADRLDPERLRGWMRRGLHADMRWMESSIEARTNPFSIMPGARSIISLAMNYYHPGGTSLPGGGRISRHAWGRDYHKVLGSRLRRLRRMLGDTFPEASFFGGVDAVPIMEKVWAQRAGLGWIGKSGLLITRSFGSWIFLATLITDLRLGADPPHPDHCGRCERCIDSCPSGAIVSPSMIDARKCIAYHTIESDGVWPDEVEAKSAGWIFGCDECQSACPWSRRFARPSSCRDLAPRKELMSMSLASFAGLSKVRFDELTRGSGLRRAGIERLRDNALVASRAIGRDGA